MGISLWIVSDDEHRIKLKSHMQPVHNEGQKPPSLSELSYPDFPLHVTLASIQTPNPPGLSELRAAIPKSQAAIPITFQSLEVGSVYFRSVYVGVKLTPEIAALHQYVHAALGIDPRTPSFPHASLCYIDDKDDDERRAFRDNLVRTGRVRTEKDGNISLGCGADADDWVTGFLGMEIWVVHSDGPVQEWKVMDKINLSK